MINSCTVIIGSTGFIGLNLLKKIRNKKNVYSISRNSFPDKKQNNHFKIDIADKKSVTNFFSELKNKYNKINLFFLAGESSVENSFKKSHTSINESIFSFLNIIESLKYSNSTIIFVSSGSIYDSRKKSYFTETDKLFPPSPYAASKYACEGIAMSYYETFGMDIRIVRMFSVFGNNMKRFFIYDLIKKISSSNGTVSLNGSGNQSRDFLHIDDVTQGLLLIMNRGAAGEVYNLSSGKAIKIKIIANKIKLILKKNNLKIIWDKNEINGIRDNWYGKNSKIKKLGFKINKSFDKSLKESVIKIYKNLNKEK